MRRLLLVLAVMLAAPASAGAAGTTTIDFEGIPNLQTIADQYAGQGVLFGAPSRFGLPSPPPFQSCSTGGQAVAGGISGTSNGIACLSGSAEFPDRKFATAFEFDTERRSVSFKISPRVSFSLNVPATLRAYGIGGQLLEERPLSLLRNVTDTVTVTRGSSEIVAIVVFGGLDTNDSGQVLIDDITAPIDDVPPPPKWSLALSTPSVEVVEGSTGTATVSVRRFNGSTGPVTLTVPDLPPGISGTLIEPNPVNGRDPVQLRITAASPMTGPRQVIVNASGGGSAGTGVVTSAVQSVTGIPAVTIAEGGRFTRTLAAGCGPQNVVESFNVRGGLRTTVNLTPVGFGGLAASASPASVVTNGDGVYPYTLVVNPLSASGIQSVRLGVQPVGATAAQLDVNFRVDAVSVAAASVATQPRPQLGQTGRAIVRGIFPAACPLSFQDGQGQNWTVLERALTEVDGRQFDLWTLQIPANGASGPLRLLGAGGGEVARTPALDLFDFRNVHGSNQVNGGAGARTNSYTWGDFVRTFGEDDTDACFLFCVRDPIASDYYDTFRGQVTANPGNGLCAGWSIMAARFSQFLGEQKPSDYQAGARRAWQISPVTDGTAFKRDVVRWHVSQNDKFFGQARTRALARSAADERALLKEAARVGGLYVSIRQGAAGHAVIAYGTQDINTPTGPGLTVAIYDPNQPYATGEETNNGTRTTALTNSTITIQGDGSWAGANFPWAGNNGTLGVVDPLPSQDAKLPSDFSLSSLFDSSGGDTPAQVTSIEADGREALRKGGEPRAGSGVVLTPAETGVVPVPRYRLAPGRSYTFGIRGTGAGRYTQGLIGNGASANVTGAATKGGQNDTVVLRPGQARLSFESAAGSAVTYNLADDLGRATRTAKIVTRAGQGGGDAVALRGGQVEVQHDGATASASITLGSVGEGLPGSVTTVPIRLADGQRLQLAPSSWKDLAGGVNATIRDRRGRVVRRGRVGLRASRRVALASVAAKAAGRKVTVTGRVSRRGGAPVLAAVVEQVRGGKVVARKAASRSGTRVKRGRFSLPVTLPRRLAGAKLRVTVTLVDEGADLASVRRRVPVG